MHSSTDLWACDISTIQLHVKGDNNIIPITRKEEKKIYFNDKTTITRIPSD